MTALRSRSHGTALLLALLIPALGLGTPIQAQTTPPADAEDDAVAATTRQQSALTTLDGQVTAIFKRVDGEGRETTEITMETATGPRLLTLAPSSVLAEMGFTVETGDRLRARVFRDQARVDIATAQQVQNRSRGQMVRLRTFRREPLWGASRSTAQDRQRPPAVTGSQARRRTQQRAPAQRPQRRPTSRPSP